MFHIWNELLSAIKHGCELRRKEKLIECEKNIHLYIKEKDEKLVMHEEFSDERSKKIILPAADRCNQSSQVEATHWGEKRKQMKASEKVHYIWMMVINDKFFIER